MKRIVLVLLTCVTLALAGCGDSDNNSPPQFVTQVVSNPTYDGDIAREPGTGTLFINQGFTEKVFAGFDPVNGDELRAFLFFSLETVPVNAVIAQATLELFIDNIDPLSASIPIRIELVSFAPPDLVGPEFDRTFLPALASTTIDPPISQLDVDGYVLVDVTILMQEAQRLGLPNFQLRILREPGTIAPGLIEINDTTGPNRDILAPLLEVIYF